MEAQIAELEAIITELQKQVKGANEIADRYARELGEKELPLRKALNDLTFETGVVQEAQRKEIEELKAEVKNKQEVIDRLIDESASIEIVQFLNKLGILKPSRSLVKGFLAEFKSAHGDNFSLIKLHDQVEKFMNHKG